MAYELPEHPPEFPAVTLEEWRTQVARELGDSSPDSLRSRTEDGLDIAPLYTAADVNDRRTVPVLAPAPAEGWDIRVELLEPEVHRAAAALRAELEGGANSARIRLASDGPRAGCGLHADTLDELDQALEGVNLEMIPIALDAGPHYMAAAAALALLWERRRVPEADRTGEFGADPLGALARSGSLSCSTREALAHVGELAAWTTARYPAVAAVRVGTEPYNDAGCTSVQEIAIALATGLEYMRAMLASGLTPDAARQLVFDLRVGTEQFQEIAKLRAFRLCWMRSLELLGASDSPVRLTASLAGRYLTRRDPWVNILRGTMACFVAATGGAEAITVPPFDSALGIPDRSALRLARNTQHVLNEEAHVGAVTDPASGSWFVESLTDRMAEAAWNLMRDIEAAGGMAAALESGLVSGWLGDARSRRERAVAHRKRPITGVSEFPLLGEAAPERPAWKGHTSRSGDGRLTSDVTESLRSLEELIGGEKREPGALMAAVIHALRAGASFGAVTSAMSNGATAEIERLEPHTLAEQFEKLRDDSDAWLARNGVRTRAFLATLGPLSQHAARAAFTSNLLEAGGVEPVSRGPLADAAAAAQEFRNSKCSIAVIVASDPVSAELAESTARALRDSGAEVVLHAGRAADRESALREAGVTDFIYQGCNAVRVLQMLHEALGVSA
jgi:methylmalonyl-CoA mutase